MRSGKRAAAGVLNIFLVAIAVAAPSAALAAHTAEYEVRFDATWSAQTHPINFPPNPHFSLLIGGTHNANVHFWALGELASTGIKDMAERGRTTPLDLEVQAAIDAGNAEAILLGGGIGVSPGSVSMRFRITQDFPLVTLVSMIAPTPDWFVGVDRLPLFENGAWRDVVQVSLIAYDAGTDSGPDYTSPNQPTVPPEPITISSAPPFADGTPLGTFTFTHVGVPVSDVGSGPAIVGMAGWPNPFRSNLHVRLALGAPQSAVLRVFDASGRMLRTLHAGRLGAGTHVFRWDGRDERGARAGSGVYFLHVRSGESRTSLKVLRVD